MNLSTITPPGYAPGAVSKQLEALIKGQQDLLNDREASLRRAAVRRDRDRSPVARIEWEQAKRSRDKALERLAQLESKRQAAGLDQIGGA